MKPKADGSPCRGSAIRGTQACYFHSPKRSKDVNAARQEGRKTQRFRRSALKELARHAVDELGVDGAEAVIDNIE